MTHTRSAAARLVAALALTLAAGFALAGPASAASEPTAAGSQVIVCPLDQAVPDPSAAIVRPCFPPCPIYATTNIRLCPPCPIYVSGLIRPCPPPCPIYLTADTPSLTVYCPPPRCPLPVDKTTDALVYCPLPER